MASDTSSTTTEKIEAEIKIFVYFKDRAVELGCKNINELGDLAIWKYIIANQGNQ